MAGVNPYIGARRHALPTRKYRIVFRVGDEERVVEVDPARLPYDETGLKGSLLEIALGHGVEIDHACGGVCACSTCHVHVLEGLASCSESDDAEQDMLDTARDVKTFSRLACQCVPDGTKDLVVRAPEWNRNLSQEGH
ncbi:MAG: 2Fe-2S iron-sulfur cluster binding domain-containing protein [Planctomycetes bacterium]|nr:2Fe-2S iron-sulfur cluster binding domain-containing protein [Planctomycetota bacterium]